MMPLASIAPAIVSMTMVCLGNATARAALPPDKAAVRRKLIDQAEAAHEAGDHVKAQDLAKRAAAMELTTSLRYFLAREEEEAGDPVVGYSGAEKCAVEAERDLSLRNRDKILEECRGIKARLQNRIGQVVIAVPTASPGMRVRVDGHDLEDAMVGVPYVVQPGTVLVDATAPGRTPFHASVKVEAGGKANVTVALVAPPAPECPPGSLAQGSGCVTMQAVSSPPVPPDAAVGSISSSAAARLAAEAAGNGALGRATAAPPAPATVPGQSSFASSQSPVAAPKRAPDTEGIRLEHTPETRHWPVGLYLTGLGGAVVAVGTVFYIISGNQASSLRGSCNAIPQKPDCTTSRLDDVVSKVHTYDRIAVISWVTGAALVAGGMTLYFRGRSRQLEGTPTANLGFDPLRRALTLEGSF